MCFAITSGPTAQPQRVTLPETVTVELGLRSATPADVTVTCTPPATLAGQVSRRVHVDGDVDVSIPVPLGGSGARGILIDVEVTQTGCRSQTRVARVVAI